MAIDSKNLLVWVKAMSRGQALPLDASEIHESLAAAQTYAASAIAYPGQSIKALLEDGKYHEYILQPSDSGYVLEEVGSDIVAAMKQYVMVVEERPEAGMQEGILYIVPSEPAGYIYTANAWKKVFWDVSAEIKDINDELDAIDGELDTKAPIANPVFSGIVKVGEEEVVLKSYVDGLFANLVSAEPGIIDSTHPLPAEYKAGMHFRVAEDGTYAGVACEVGDLILVVKNYNAETASNDDFMVLQANVDGAVTSSAEVSTIGEVVVFDSVTGKVIKGSGIQLASLNDVIAKAHEHKNMTVLNTFNKTQTEILEAANTSAQSLVSALQQSVNTSLAGKADKASTLEGYGIQDAYNKTEINGFIETINGNLNTKITGSEVDTKITNATDDILAQAAEDASDILEARVGSIAPTQTIKQYVDSVVSTGSSDCADAIEKARQNAIETSNKYTDDKIAEKMKIVEF